MTEFKRKCQWVLYLLAVNKDTGNLPRELATEALLDMGRKKCPVTGNDYFETYDPY